MAQQQTCLIQPFGGKGSPIVSKSQLVPTIELPHQVLVKVLAVALNPTDHKMPSYHPVPGAVMGCDFMGVVAEAGSEVHNTPVGTRVCGFVHGSNPGNPNNGAFAQYLVQDVRFCLRVPDTWSDLEGAALGGVGWGTVGLTAEACLQLTGTPSKPAPPRVDGTRIPVLVYGGATASGTMACQILSKSGYDPISTCSPSSAALVKKFGAVATVPYASPTCGETLKTLTKGSLRHALDCVTTRESLACCFTALGRVGGRYTSLDYPEDDWKTRRAVKCEVPMTYVVMGKEVELPEPYHRPADPEKFELGVRWCREIQNLLDQNQLKCHPVREVLGGWNGIIEGLDLLTAGKVRGHKLVVRLPSSN